MRKFFATYFFILLFLNINSQVNRTITAEFSDLKIKIDGYPIDSSWQEIAYESDFVQFEPYNNANPTSETFIKVLYDNQAVYVLAYCQSNNKSDYYTILSQRDNFGQADYFGFYIDTYNTGLTGYGFFVTAAGVQVDVKIDNNSQSYDWDEVWYSRVNLTDSGYYAEIKIPFSAIRFPKKDEQIWRINFYRNIQKNREISTWNYVDNQKTGILNQLGYLENIRIINPPLRLSFMPYLSSYVQKYTNSPVLGKSYNGGMDFKYGINESFTIDMMLIPDFNQIQSDEQTLNLSPYETYYDEKRYFFTEGVEIFNKGDIFYSRRIGKEPTKYDDVEGLLKVGEVIVKNPPITQIYNATKFSGKTNKGLGIGFLNAFTGSTYAEILDTSNNLTRTILTEPFSNYNVIALNQPLPNNSYLSLTNTNFSSFGRHYSSFVTAQEGYIRNKSNSWAIFEQAALNQIINDTMPTDRGFCYKYAIYKTSGKFRLFFSQVVYSSSYNPNDLGYLRQNNLVTNTLNLSYNILKPFGYFLNWKNSLVIKQQSLFDSLKYIGTDLTYTSSTKLKNNTTFGLSFNITPDEVYDYFEPRVQNKFYVREPIQSFSSWISTNYANPFAVDFIGSFYYARIDEDAQNGFSFLFSPRLRFSEKAFFIYSSEFVFDYNNIGYVGKSQIVDSVFFGKRNIQNRTNTLEFEYIFSENIFMGIKLRHYWSIVDYFQYYTLADNGKLYPLLYSYQYIDNQDINYNNFTVDVVFRLLFSPGSEFSIVYKKQIISSSDDLMYDYYDNFEKMYFDFAHLNSFSFKFIFYLDYNTYSNILKKRK